MYLIKRYPYLLLQIWPEHQSASLSYSGGIALLAVTLPGYDGTSTKRRVSSKADFDWPTQLTRVTLTSYPVYAAHAIPRE